MLFALLKSVAVTYVMMLGLLQYVRFISVLSDGVGVGWKEVLLSPVQAPIATPSLAISELLLFAVVMLTMMLRRRARYVATQKRP